MARSRAYYEAMRRFVGIATVLALSALPAGAGKASPKAPRKYINWAASWSDALEEARACNVPIVVHRHGFY